MFIVCVSRSPCIKWMFPVLLQVEYSLLPLLIVAIRKKSLYLKENIYLIFAYNLLFFLLFVIFKCIVDVYLHCIALFELELGVPL